MCFRADTREVSVREVCDSSADEKKVDRLSICSNADQKLPDLSPSSSNSSDEVAPDQNQSTMSKNKTLSDLTSQLNFIDDDDDNDVTQVVASSKPIQSSTRVETANEPKGKNEIRERKTVPPDNLPLSQISSVRPHNLPLSGTSLTDDSHLKSRSLPGYQSANKNSRPGPYDGCRAGGFFIKSALPNEADRDEILSRVGRIDSKEEQATSDSDVGDIVPSPTSSSRDSLDERSGLRSNFNHDPKHFSGSFLGASKGSFTSMSFPQLPQISPNDPKSTRFSKALSSDDFQGNQSKESHFPTRSISVETNRSYTG